MYNSINPNNPAVHWLSLHERISSLVKNVDYLYINTLGFWISEEDTNYSVESKDYIDDAVQVKIVAF